MIKPLPPTKQPRTVRVARAATQHEGRELVEPRELIEAPFAKGQSPSLSARRTLLLMVAAAAANGFANQIYRLTKKELRQGHKSNERITDILTEVIGIRFEIPGLSSRGRAAIIKSFLFEEIVTETDDGDKSWVEFEFSRRARALFGGSEVYAVLNRTALLAFQAKYSVTLYQLGCLHAGRRDPTIRLTMPELRQKLGIPEGTYADFSLIRRFVLDKARAEVDQLAHFQVTIKEHREGRAVRAVTLGFWRKSDDAIDAAADELGKAKPGRKSRRAPPAPPSLPPIEEVAAAGRHRRAEPEQLDIEDAIRGSKS